MSSTNISTNIDPTLYSSALPFSENARTNDLVSTKTSFSQERVVPVASKCLNNQPEVNLSTLMNLNARADKEIVNKPKEVDKYRNTLNKYLPLVDKFANYSAIASNLVNFFLQTLDLSESNRNKINSLVNFITNMSMMPYGADGMWKGIKKHNPFQALGFFMEIFSVWFSNLKTKYLIRGMATGIDQIWVATDFKLSDKYKNGNMLNWKNGFIDVLKASGQLLKEIVMDPVSTLITTKSKGHHAILSTIGDIIATLGYAVTGKENIFGPIRDISGILFDFELLLRDKLIQKFSGVFFILESAFDFLARVMDNNVLRIAVNSLSLASGRLALSLYKASDPN
jgi:hypothetical protein